MKTNTQRETIEHLVSLSLALDIQAAATRAVFMKRAGDIGLKEQEEVARLTARITGLIAAYMDED